MSSIIQLLLIMLPTKLLLGRLYKDPLRLSKLLENAVDAKATDIKLVIKDGKALVQVIDMGGMGVTDARLCFERHDIKNTS
jgi:DNA mismatch repair protein MutL